MARRKSATERAMAELAAIRKDERRLAAREKKAVAVIKRERDRYQRELVRCEAKRATKRTKKATKKRAAKKRTKKAAKKKAAKKTSKRSKKAKPVLTRRDVATAARKLAGKRERVRLRDLRPLLGGTRAQQDEALLSGQDTGLWVLYRDDATRSLTSADKAAAVDVGGYPRHLLYLD